MKKLILTVATILSINAINAQSNKTTLDSLKQVKKDLQLKTKENRETIKALKETAVYTNLLKDINKLDSLNSAQLISIEMLNNKNKVKK